MTKMSFFNRNIEGGYSDDAEPNWYWNYLEDVAELDEIEKASYHIPVLIFKHSTRCMISRMALKQFENDFDLNNFIKPYLLDLLQHRDVSNAIAARFGIFHQSPQIILIKDGKAIFDTSHEQINAHDLKSLVV